MKRSIIINLTLLCFTIFFIIIFAEITLRFMPVNSSFKFLPVNVNNPIFRATPNRDSQFSLGWNFLLANIKHANNEGFINKLDFSSQDSRPLVAIVGASYVEASQVKDEETFYYLLAKENPHHRFYSFAFSGADLGQFLIWAQYAQENYHNDFLIVTIADFHFEKALGKYKSHPGFHDYEETTDGKLQLVRRDWKPNKLMLFLNHSYLVRYLIANCKILEISKLIKAKFTSSETNTNNQLGTNDDIQEKDSYLALDAFLADLPRYSGLVPQDIVLLVDGLRQDIYEDNESVETFDTKMVRYLHKKAESLGYNIIDLHHSFGEHYQKHHQKFEFPFDGHWNVIGHQVVAQAIQSSDWWQKVALLRRM